MSIIVICQNNKLNDRYAHTFGTKLNKDWFDEANCFTCSSNRVETIFDRASALFLKGFVTCTFLDTRYMKKRNG